MMGLGVGWGVGTNYWGPAIDYVAYVFVFLGGIVIGLYKLALSDQAPVTLQLRVSLFDSVSRFLAGLHLLGGLNPVTGSPADRN
jgi:hypothetical protein